jgi:squalene-associated FAD-dependent desaturase
MAPQCGGRARGIEVDGLILDNGQHIGIGAYVEVLRLMRIVGADPDLSFLRLPLELRQANGAGLSLGPGPAVPAFIWAVIGHPGWTWLSKLALLATTARWALAGFRCQASLDVAALTKRLPSAIRDELIDPLCVAALNTPAEQASAQVFLRVLKDALFSSAGSSDLLLPRVNLSNVLPEPALIWLRRLGAEVRTSERVMEIRRAESAWEVAGIRFDQIVLATPPREAARLVTRYASEWAALARELQYEPIVTLYVRGRGIRLPAPMLALRPGPARPAQFVFDRARLGGPDGLLAFVISGAAAWVEAGSGAILEATLRQASELFGTASSGIPLKPVRLFIEKRATFRCTPGLRRPAATIVPGLVAAGDYVAGPYPATLEGAVRSGVDAARSLSCSLARHRFC